MRILILGAGVTGTICYLARDKDCLILRFGRGKPQNWQHVYPQLFAALTELL